MSAPNWKHIGKEFEKKVKVKALEANGFIVEIARPVLYFIGQGQARSRAEDFFKAFDLIALHPTEPPYTWLIQCTVGGDRARQQRQVKILEKFEWLAPNVGQKVQIWQRDDEKKQLVHIWTLQGDKSWAKSEFEFNYPDMKAVLN